MKLFSKVMLFCAVTTSTLLANKTTIVDYVVQKGDTLFSIARYHHTTIEEVKTLNQFKKGAILKPNNHLKVSLNTYFPIERYNKKTKREFTYTIAQGDVLSLVAQKYNTTVKELCQINKIGKKKVLKVGSHLRVMPNTALSILATTKGKSVKKKHLAKKKKTSIAKRTFTYKVAKGDTLSHIAKIHHMPLKTLLLSNHLSSKTLLKTGQKLKIAQKYKVKKVHIAHKKKRAKKQYVFTTGKSKKGSRLTSLAKRKLGKRYVWGATGSNTFDCSGLTSYVCKKNGIRIPRRAIAQSRVGKRIGMKNLKVGDLVFFDTSKRRRGYVNHVGIYIGNGKFIHASSAKKRVVITSLNKPFYKQRFKWARRVVS